MLHFYERINDDDDDNNLTYFGHVLGSVDTPDRYIMIGETTGTVGRRRHRKEIEE